MGNFIQHKKEVKEHRNLVQSLLLEVIFELADRGKVHDLSKERSPEREVFAKYTDKLSDVTYGSDEYYELMEKIESALEHHYEENRHHPEHWEEGITDMNLIDLIEMFCDWWAATERHDDGGIKDSLKENYRRFDMSPQLMEIFLNTVRDMEGGIHGELQVEAG